MYDPKCPIRCDICGRFIGFRQVVQGEIRSVFEFDSEYTKETLIFWHRECEEHKTYG